MFELRDFSATAVTAHLVSDMDNLSDTISLDNSTGWPTGGVNGDFMVQVEDEVIRCASRTGNTVQVAGSGRGYDGTAATDHTASVEVTHVLSKIDLYEANVAASETVGKATAAGQILVTDGVNSFVAVNNVTGLSLVGGTTSPSYAALGTNGYGDDTVTNAKLAPDSVGPTELQTDSVGTLELAPIAVTAAEIATSVAGAGLTGGAGTPLAVNTDNATIEVASDVVQLSATYRWEAGDIKYSARSTPTTGWLLCDGSAVNRTTYADLFTAIGTTYGVGDGSNTFNVPDYRGKSILGAGTGSGLTARTRGDSGGSETISTAELPVHTHTIDHNHPAVTSSSDGNHTHTQIVRLFGGGASGGAGGVVDAASYVNVNETGAAGAHTHSVDVAALTGNSGSTGSGDPHMPPFGVANVFIKT